MSCQLRRALLPLVPAGRGVGPGPQGVRALGGGQRQGEHGAGDQPRAARRPARAGRRVRSGRGAARPGGRHPLAVRVPRERDGGPGRQPLRGRLAAPPPRPIRRRRGRLRRAVYAGRVGPAFRRLDGAIFSSLAGTYLAILPDAWMLRGRRGLGAGRRGPPPKGTSARRLAVHEKVPGMAGHLPARGRVDRPGPVRRRSRRSHGCHDPGGAGGRPGGSRLREGTPRHRCDALELRAELDLRRGDPAAREAADPGPRDPQVGPHGSPRPPGDEGAPGSCRPPLRRRPRRGNRRIRPPPHRPRRDVWGDTPPGVSRPPGPRRRRPAAGHRTAAAERLHEALHSASRVLGTDHQETAAVRRRLEGLAKK